MAIKINIGSLKDGSQQIDFLTDSKELDLDEKLIKGKLQISVELFKASNQIDLKVNMKGLLKLVCDRCLEVFENPFDSNFELVYVQKTARDNNIDNDYIKTYNPFMRTIDITNDVREYVLLSVPMKKIPPEINDKCSWCGKSKTFWNKDIFDEDYINTLKNN